tara:strand:+ start:616 stop:1266 length:651 start_codon:yes stop_codon:yes gene_type:complete
MAASDTTTVAPPNGIVIEYMDESTNSRHVEKHTTARTVAEFITKEHLSANATVSVNDIIADADGSTPINEGDTVTVVSGNKTGGIGTQRRVKSKPRGFDISVVSGNDLTPDSLTGLSDNGTVEHRLVTTVKTTYNGKKQTFAILEGLEMPARMSGRISKYPFHLLQAGQCFHVPLKQSKTISAAMRTFMKKNPNVVLQGRTHILGRNTLFGIWRTV